jgi:hypothetical protein
VNEPLVFGLIVIVLVGLLVGADRMRRRPRAGEAEAAVQQAVVDAERDGQKTDAVEAKEIAGHQWPGGSL